MFEAIFYVVLIALIGSLSVPAAMLLLARFGLFDPIEFETFGYRWRFAPKPSIPATYVILATSIASTESASNLVDMTELFHTINSTRNSDVSSETIMHYPQTTTISNAYALIE